MNCPEPQTLAALLDGETTANETASLRAHLALCASCQAQLRRLETARDQLVAHGRSSPDPAFARDVLARVSNERKTHWRLKPAWALGMVAAAAVAVVWIRPHGAEDSGFAARGSAAPDSNAHALGFEAFVHSGGPTAPGAVARAGDTLHARDGLSFVLYNRSRHAVRYLLFGVDSAGEVHWFYPAFPDARANPLAQELAAEPQMISLPQGVVMDAPALGKFRLVALFVPRETSAKEVEVALQGGDLDKLAIAFPGSFAQTLSLNLLAP